MSSKIGGLLVLDGTLRIERLQDMMRFLRSRKIEDFLALLYRTLCGSRPKPSARASTTGITTLLKQRRKERVDVIFMMDRRLTGQGRQFDTEHCDWLIPGATNANGSGSNNYLQEKM
jgi:hypothetical protein